MEEVKDRSHQYSFVGFYFINFKQKQNQRKKLLHKCNNKCAASYDIGTALLNVGELFKWNNTNLELKKFSA